LADGLDSLAVTLEHGNSQGDILKTLALIIAVLIAAVGAIGLIAPSNIVWVAQHSLSAGALYFIAAVRLAFGILLMSVAATSRMPKFLQIVGIVVLLSGIATVMMAMFAVDTAAAMVDWWIAQGNTVDRLTGIPLIAIGSLIAHACAPQKRSG
jgi:hypothetical protein